MPMSPVLRLLTDLWPSALLSLVAAVGAFLSMGMLGLVLYYLVSPLLNVWFSPLEAWDQSQVWPVIIAMPIVWAPAFLIAGIVNRQTKLRGSSRRARIALYFGILWLAALAAWLVLLPANPTLWH
jgi:hypothetical protein